MYLCPIINLKVIISVAKQLTDFKITKTTQLTPRYQLLSLSAPDNCDLSIIKPGQFVQIKIENNSTFLRRPISIHDVDINNHIIDILVCRHGEGTNYLCDMPSGSTINMMWPLGNSFSIPSNPNDSVLLIGGGVGVAPLLYLGKHLKDSSFNVNFLLAARTANDLLRLDAFKAIGQVYLSTDDGSIGEKGLITQNTILNESFKHVFCCGPMPMMKAIAHICQESNINCEVSLENVMACGIGACLCCVEKTIRGNRCACTDGPVFNIDELTW